MSGPRLDRYRVLGAAYAMSKFTVADLAAYSEVSKANVRKILSRDAKFFRNAGDIPQERGRPTQVYELCPEHTVELDSFLGRFRDYLREISPSSEEAPNSNQMELDLLAVERIVLNEFPAAKDPGVRRKLLRVAEDYRANYREEESGATQFSSRWWIADALLELARMELLWEKGTNLFFLGRSLFRLLSKIKDLLPSLEDELQTDVRERLRSSRLLQELTLFLPGHQEPVPPDIGKLKVPRKPRKIKLPRAEYPLVAAASFRETIQPIASMKPDLASVACMEGDAASFGRLLKRNDDVGLPSGHAMLRASDVSSLCPVKLVQVDLDDPGVRQLVMHVSTEFRSELGRFSFEEFQDEAVLRGLRKVPLSLVAINSRASGVDRVLKIAGDMRELSQDVCVFDVHADLELRDRLCSLGANYVGAAQRLDRRGLLTTVPLLSYAVSSFEIEETMSPQTLHAEMAYQAAP